MDECGMRHFGKNIWSSWFPLCVLCVLCGGAVAGETALQLLIKKLSDPDVDLCKQAVRQLRSYGTAAKEAVPALSRLAKEDKTKLSIEAIETLGKLGAEAAPALIE